MKPNKNWINRTKSLPAGQMNTRPTIGDTVRCFEKIYDCSTKKTYWEVHEGCVFGEYVLEYEEQYGDRLCYATIIQLRCFNYNRNLSFLETYQTFKIVLTEKHNRAYLFRLSAERNEHYKGVCEEKVFTRELLLEKGKFEKRKVEKIEVVECGPNDDLPF